MFYPVMSFGIPEAFLSKKMEKSFKDAYFCVKRNRDVKMIYAKKYHDRVKVALAREIKTPKNLCKKFSFHWKGPYTVTNKVTEVTYKLKPVKRGKNLEVH